MKRCMNFALLLTATFTAMGCADDDKQPDTSTVSATELLAPGGYPVGFRELELSYSAAGTGDMRTIPIKVWYPAVDAGEGKAEYSVAGIVDVPTDDALAAPAISADGPFPLAVYSHGSGGEGLLAYPYGELFASHGWVVVSPSHSGNTINDQLMMASDAFPIIALNRPNDISATLDWLTDGLGGDPLAEQTRTDKVFLFGHSFGAYTTFAAGGVDVDRQILKANCGTSADCALYDDPRHRSRLRRWFWRPAHRRHRAAIARVSAQLRRRRTRRA